MSEENENFAAHEGCLYSKDLSVLIGAPGGLQGTLNVSENCKVIGDYCLCYCPTVTSVYIPDSVTSIGTRAFFYCSGLRFVSIGKGVALIGNYSFAYGYELNRMIFYGTKEPEYGENVFLNCYTLREIGVPFEYEGDLFLGKKVKKQKLIDIDTTTEPTEKGPGIALVASLVSVAVVVAVAIVVVMMMYFKKVACFTTREFVAVEDGMLG